MNTYIQRIIDVCCELLADEETAASSGEQIAAAFVLNRMDFLPKDHYNIYEAWEWIGPVWQGYVKEIRKEYMQHIQ